MPHRLFELSEMNREQLETIANEHNVIGIKKLDDENLAYAILDAEAKEESLKPIPEKPKKRRGRPPKVKPVVLNTVPAVENIQRVDEDKAIQEKRVEEVKLSSPEAPINPVKRGRGRPRKIVEPQVDSTPSPSKAKPTAVQVQAVYNPVPEPTQIVTPTPEPIAVAAPAPTASPTTNPLPKKRHPENLSSTGAQIKMSARQIIEAARQKRNQEKLNQQKAAQQATQEPKLAPVPSPAPAQAQVARPIAEEPLLFEAVVEQSPVTNSDVQSPEVKQAKKRGRKPGSKNRSKLIAAEQNTELVENTEPAINTIEASEPVVEVSAPVVEQPTTSVATQASSKQSKNKASIQYEGTVEATGVLELMPDGYGFLRSSDYNYLNSPDDIYVSQQQIKLNGLKNGDTIIGEIRPPREGDKYFPLVKIKYVNGRDIEFIRDRVPFDFLTPLFPDEKFNLVGKGYERDKSCRIVDMFSPIGKGQRMLIVSPPKAGKTMLLKSIANAIADNHPEVYEIVLLVDERPEEVTDMQRSVKAEVVASTFDEPAEKHVKVANMVIEKARRLVECGHDVVILLDSITRLARAYNTVQPASGKVLTGGVDANALQKPKRFFGAARNIEGGGSLTILATALTETGSKMDEVIFEEFKGTGNSEIQLDRSLANRRIFPAVNVLLSGTRRDDLLYSHDQSQRIWILRKLLADMTSTEAMNFMLQLMDEYKTNKDLLDNMSKVSLR